MAEYHARSLGRRLRPTTVRSGADSEFATAFPSLLRQREQRSSHNLLINKHLPNMPRS